jgi:uncharacterized membrane protein (Fun14 family)
MTVQSRYSTRNVNIERKVVRIAAIISGLFLAGLAYLQYQQIASINWDNLEQASEGVVRTFANAITLIDTDNIGVAEFAIINGIPMTSSMSIGFTIGFLKG